LDPLDVIEREKRDMESNALEENNILSLPDQRGSTFPVPLSKGGIDNQAQGINHNVNMDGLLERGRVGSHKNGNRETKHQNINDRVKSQTITVALEPAEHKVFTDADF
jgi:hypothetical protein